MSRRLYVQYRPQSPDLDVLLNAQAIARDLNPFGRRVSAERIHLTIIHFGIISEIYEQLLTVKPTLSWQVFTTAVEAFVQASEAAMPPTTVVRPWQYNLFGPAGTVLVLEVTAETALRTCHRRALEALQHCLKQCDIADPAAYMAADDNFKHALTFRPHITLLRGAKHIPTAGVTVERLNLLAMPTLYD